MALDIYGNPIVLESPFSRRFKSMVMNCLNNPQCKNNGPTTDIQIQLQNLYDKIWVRYLTLLNGGSLPEAGRQRVKFIDDSYSYLSHARLNIGSIHWLYYGSGFEFFARKQEVDEAVSFLKQEFRFGTDFQQIQHEVLESILPIQQKFEKNQSRWNLSK